MEMKRIDAEEVRSMFPPRDRNACKGDFGHALLIAGKHGMMGAALLAAGAALRSGCGLVTVHVPSEDRLAVHISHPSAIVSPYEGGCFSGLPANLQKYTSAGIGPGLGQAEETAAAVGLLLAAGHPLVLDADALNIISSHPSYLARIPAGSILTPHDGELRRLLRAAVSSGFIGGLRISGEKVWKSRDERTDMALALAAGTGSVVVCKGAGSVICPPSGRPEFNPSGNPGMAKGGSGDVLAGFLTGLMARGFSARDAAVAGVYLHGAAGDMAAEKYGEESMNASDILGCLRI